MELQQEKCTTRAQGMRVCLSAELPGLEETMDELDECNAAREKAAANQNEQLMVHLDDVKGQLHSKLPGHL